MIGWPVKFESSKHTRKKKNGSILHIGRGEIKKWTKWCTRMDCHPGQRLRYHRLFNRRKKFWFTQYYLPESMQIYLVLFVCLFSIRAVVN